MRSGRAVVMDGGGCGDDSDGGWMMATKAVAMPVAVAVAVAVAIVVSVLHVSICAHQPA